MTDNSLSVKTERYLFLDIMKVIALFFMPCVHIFNILTGFDLAAEQFPFEALSSQMGCIYLIGPGVFMFCMGAGIVLSKKQTAHDLFSRGLKLLLIGFVLNVVRASIFIWFGLLWETSYFISFWYWLWGSDILYFAGLYFLVFSLFRKLKLPDWAIPAVSAAMLVVSHIIMPVPVENQTLIELFGNFVYIDGDSCFPLLSWTIIPTVGYLYMKGFVRSGRKKRYVLSVSALSAVILAAFAGTLFATGNMQTRYLLWGEDAFMMDIPSAVIAILIALVYSGIIYGISTWIKDKKLTEALGKISAGVNTIYCIHWVLVTYLGFFWLLLSDHRVKSGFAVYLIGALIFIVSTLLALGYRKHKERI